MSGFSRPRSLNHVLVLIIDLMGSIFEWNLHLAFLLHLGYTKTDQHVPSHILVYMKAKAKYDRKYFQVYTWTKTK